MKRFQVAFSLIVFLGIALAFVLQRPVEPTKDELGFEAAVPIGLPPLRPSAGELELSGRVETDAGAPAADTLVTLFLEDTDGTNAPSTHEPLHWTYTDERGAFILRRLDEGAYRAILTLESAPPTVQQLTLPHPEPVVWRLAAPLSPLPSLPDIRRGVLEGRIFASGDPELGSASLEGFEVVLRPEDDVPPLAGAATRRTTCDAGGRFALGDLVLARYRVEALPPWARGGSWPVVASVTYDLASTGTSVLDLPLVVGALSGELLENADQPLEGALVRIVSLDAVDAAGAPQAWPPEVTDASGRFAFTHLPPGGYRVHLSAGLCSRAVEGRVEVGRVTRLPLAPMDPRAAE